jgi:hypothetical protein
VDNFVWLNVQHLQGSILAVNPIYLESECLRSDHIPTIRRDESDLFTPNAEMLFSQLINDWVGFVGLDFICTQDVP